MSWQIRHSLSLRFGRHAFSCPVRNRQRRCCIQRGISTQQPVGTGNSRGHGDLHHRAFNLVRALQTRHKACASRHLSTLAEVRRLLRFSQLRVRDL